MRLLVPLFAALGLSGCVSLLPEPPPAPRIYRLEAPAAAAPAAAMAMKPVVIAVAAPSAPRALAGSEIAWRENGRLAYAEGAALEGRGMDLLHLMLIHALDDRDEVKGAVRLGEARADMELHWHLAAFEIVEEDLTARVEARVKAFDGRTRALLADRVFTARETLRTRSAGSAAEALGAASGRATQEIARWAAEVAPTSQ